MHACHVRFVSPETSTTEGEGTSGQDDTLAYGSWEVVTASGEGEVKGWLIEESGLVQGIKEEEDGEVSFMVQAQETQVYLGQATQLKCSLSTLR